MMAVLNRVAALLPQACTLCGSRSGERLICHACAADLPVMPADCCPICALPAPGASVCGACLKHAPNFDASHAVWRYEFPIDRMVQSLKYMHRLASADFFGEALADLASRQGGHPGPDLIMPVPLSVERLAERGFNQSVEIARPLARALKVPIELNAVRRHRHTAPQAGLPWKERAGNIRHAFECSKDLSGKTIWVIDDVMTTGSTLNELARVLKAHGALRVENFTVARTLKD
jgi:ComF family protein